MECVIIPLILIIVIIIAVPLFSVFFSSIEAIIKRNENTKIQAKREIEVKEATELEAKKRAEREREEARKVEEQVRREDERSAKFQEKSNKFVASPEYKLVEQFAKKYGYRGNESEFSKLQMLLKTRQWDFTSNELETLLNVENKIQRKENVKAKILGTNPTYLREHIKGFLQVSRSDSDENLGALLELLKEKGLYNYDLRDLKFAVKEIEDQIELENFEKRLNEGNEQIFFETIDQLNGYEFEDFLKNLFSKMGYKVEQTKLSGDQGADLVVVKFGEKTVIQAKRYGAKVGNYAVQEIMAAISLYKAQKGMVITNNYFTPAAVELANANNIKLIDRDSLEELINKHW